MKIKLRIYIYLIMAALFASCSTSKFIPEGHYLLDEVSIVSDTKEVQSSSFSSYIRQNPNAKWFSLVKVPLHIYCLSGKDSTNSFNRFLRKLGDAPVIYDSSIAEKSQKEMEKAVRNMGYMRARVYLDTEVKKKKMKVNYRIQAGRPYTIQHIAYDIDDMIISDFIEKDSASSLLRVGMPFDVVALDNERQRITKMLQNNGYYKFNKDFIVYQADTVRNSYQVNLIMKLLPFQLRKEDIPTRHQQYTVRNVNFWADGTLTDTLKYKGLQFFYQDKLYVRPNTLANFNYIQPQQLYKEQDVQNTYTSMGRLRALKYTNIRFDEVIQNDSAMLDANILLTKGKNQSLSFEIEGTNSAGDLGAAASLTFQHRNVFRGSETFTIKVRGAYEAITGLQEGYESDDYEEYGVEASLNFPEFKFPFLSSDFKRKIRATSEVGIDFNSQNRPEFTRTLASASWGYRWVDNKASQHRVDLLDVNYIYVPWKSENFKNYLENLTDRNSILIKSYEDQLIVRMGYTYIYNSANDKTRTSTHRNSYSIRMNLEEAGNLLYLASKVLHSKPKADKGYEIANIPFAQYVKGDFDFAQNWNIDKRNSFVFHIGMGVAYSYGNSQILPFEKRYFSGGPNSVRGWSVRSLGPGSYTGAKGNMNYINHSGDIKLDVNLEYRTHLFWKFNGAAFIDVGNIWNIRDYEGQEEGTFRFNRFYKQLAVAYGLGLRFDLDYLILRFDGGMKAINPMKTGKDKYPFVRPNFNRDFAFHFAVGYPF
ncbi:MAG: BamA/TamA family outer membrane protein [Bacteroides sp]|nr:BamA/TamA family outer membrane protein [Bacteroidaceae bacterium]MBQ3190697.1 BamA/TamA family outer membrane protein [Bacteroides sp.]MBQ3191222.1 BamA/TamA family outer membrane protein [Bacteroides sp.]